jgi:hypothetical protein
MSHQIQKGTIGAEIILTVRDQANAILDISTATTKEIIFRKPDGTTVTKTAVFVSNGTDGKVKYTTVSNDLDQVSVWKMQARIVTPTMDARTTLATMAVLKNAVD